ncbi:hypothetical protein E3N88_10319 [Mikania micrantha]|uniref:Uncharacterized protein n=1 Tax=Mikania micrantha TaxID=192012 RepID=A0A5N6PBA8_9ASTR|nr:hypothetical protein E3N88_10319 [Mikania micrantha]
MTTHLSPANCRLLHPTDTTATATVAVIECTQTGGQMHEFITSATSNTSKASSTDDQRSLKGITTILENEDLHKLGSGRMTQVNAIIDMIHKEDFNTIFDHVVVNNDDVLEDEIENDMDDELEEDSSGDETQTGRDETQVPSTYTNLEEANLNIDDNWMIPYNERQSDINRELGKDLFKDKDEFTRAVKLYNIRSHKHFEVIESRPTT